MNTRRDFLKKASLLAGGAALWNTLPAAIQKAVAIDPDVGSTFFDAEHIIFLMQENRSFDHCFGTLQGVRGFNDPRIITLPDSNPVWIQTNKEGKSYVPFRLDMKDTKATWMGGLPHSWENQVDARNNGKYDQWLETKKPGNKEYRDMPLTLGYYTREDIPFYYALADAFTVCDQHFCSALTGTTTNRTFFWTGKIRKDPADFAHIRNSDIYYNKEVNWKTFPERLEENGISWKVYQNEISLQAGLEDEDDSWLGNFTDNNLEWFSQYNVRFHKAHHDFLVKRASELPAEIEKLENDLKNLNHNQAAKIKKQLTQKKEQLEKYKREINIWSPENFEKLTPLEKNLHIKAFTTNVNDPNYHKTAPFSYQENEEERTILLPKGDVLHQFRDDVESGKLPTVSWLVAPQNFSDHPSAPWFGAWYVSEVLDILTKNPEVWKKTIFILNYDENDGYFDHVPPFVAPKPGDVNFGAVSEGIDTSDEYVTLKEELDKSGLNKADARESPVGFGYRVPLVIASPWSRGGWVNSEVFDITSTLQFLEVFLSKKTGKEIKETNIGDWRRCVSGDLTSAFRKYNGEKINFPKPVELDPFVKEIYNAKFKKIPGGYKQLNKSEIESIKNHPAETLLLPQQEIGIRNSPALPYDLNVQGNLSKDGNQFEITFSAGSESFASKAKGAPFNVYAPGKYLGGENNVKQTFEPVRAWSYAVKAGDILKSVWPLSHFENGFYHLRVYGPNGFFREFSGDKSDPQVEILAENNIKKSQVDSIGNLVIKLRNTSGKSQVVVIENKYAKTIRTIEMSSNHAEVVEMIDLQNSFNWYDVLITVKNNPGFQKRFAGRIETGQPGKTDPLMGRVLK